jgi:hypothetical protein
MSRLAATLLAVVLAVAAAGCFHGDDEEADETAPPMAEPQQPAEPDQEPGEYVQSLIERAFEGETGAVWAELHPAHQEAASEEVFERCLNLAREFADLERIEIDDVTEETVTLDGEELTAQAVLLQITVSPFTDAAEQTVSDTRRVVAVDGDWNWFLNQAEIDAYEGDGCPRPPFGGSQ